MKKFKLIAIVLFLAVIMPSCSSDSEGNDTEDLTCVDALNATMEASQAFEAATDANYTQLCAAYKAALMVQIDICGDVNGSLQAMVDDLGDCTIDETNMGVISVKVGTLQKTFETNITVVVDGTTRKVTAEDDATSDWIYFEIEEGATGVDVISNFNIHLISSDYLPASNAGGTFTSTITVNSASTITGTFHGMVESPTTGADISLTSGIFNVEL